MYLKHFGLDEAPFRITPHTDFFFDGANRGATLEALLYAIVHDEGIVKVTGEVGSGKTMLCRVLMERLPPDVETIYLANPSLERDEIMLAILDDLKAPAAGGERSSLILRNLQERLVALYAENRKVVVLIDEAHAMPVETLEEIRLLSNLESKRHKLLQIVLFGQQELDDVLGTPQMRQLKERIVHGFELSPLVRSDIGSYVMFRMRQAGYKGPDLFSDGAIRRINDVSEGLTRRINILADKALLAAFSDGAYQILPKHVNAAIADSEFARLSARRTNALSTTTLAVAAAGFLAAGAGAALLAIYVAAMRPGGLTAAVVSEAPPTMAKRAVSVAPPDQVQAAPAKAPPTKSAAAVPSEAEKPPLTAEAAPPTARPQHPNGRSDAARAPAPGPQETTAAAAPTASGVSPSRPNSPPEAAVSKRATAAAPGESTLLDRRLHATTLWIKQAPNNTYTLQLLTADAARASDVNTWLNRLPDGMDAEHIFIYLSTIRGLRRFSVLYGAYPDRNGAAAALDELPKTMRSGKPLIRTVAGIRQDLAVR